MIILVPVTGTYRGYEYSLLLGNHFSVHNLDFPPIFLARIVTENVVDPTPPRRLPLLKRTYSYEVLYQVKRLRTYLLF